MTAGPHAGTVADAVPFHPGELLAEVVRGPLVESVHLGHVVVVAPDGGIAFALGEPGAVVWPRSSLKPLQAVAMLRAGLEVDDDGLALACASHNGEPGHLDVVRRVLGSAGLGEADLQNTPDLPLDPAAAAGWREAGGGPTSLTQNCSGKHAAMLVTCALAGWPTTGYLAADHPLQRAIRAGVEELTGAPVEHVTVDGCGAPLLSTTVVGLAHGFARLVRAAADAPSSAEGRVAAAVRTRPWLVGGTGRDVTAFCEAVPGLVAKDGAEGVYAAALPDGTALALKLADGGGRGRPAVMAAALEVALQVSAVHGRHGVDDDVVAAVRAVGRTPVLGHGAPVGEVRTRWSTAWAADGADGADPACRADRAGVVARRDG
ncbi:asparaginase [Actinotalea sp. Marseille-Q4924]|uniref:asparaginase n=1 Tax=Actinotalea sp. Marseille-Q4924 TaxID=2866571 RepID=UPI001CE41A27|nr:asparaginase [Actinotalea sp. Marseille-Q4924]